LSGAEEGVGSLLHVGRETLALGKPFSPDVKKTPDPFTPL